MRRVWYRWGYQTLRVSHIFHAIFELLRHGWVVWRGGRPYGGGSH